MTGDVLREKAEELFQRGIIILPWHCTAKHHLAIGTNGVVDLVALTELESAAHRFRDGGLVPLGERGFGFEGGGHNILQGEIMNTVNGNADALQRQYNCIRSR